MVMYLTGDAVVDHGEEGRGGGFLGGAEGDRGERSIRGGGDRATSWQSRTREVAEVSGVVGVALR